MADALSGEVELPAVGGVDKRVVIGVMVAAAAYIGWRYYSARSGDQGDDTTTTDPGYADDGTIPGVTDALGNVWGSNPVTDTEPAADTDSYGFNGTTNSQWTQYVTGQLSQSDTWSISTIQVALGNYLDGRPLSTLQQSIVRAAIAVGGNPPVGTHTIISGGDTTLRTAPTGLHVVSRTDREVRIGFTAVPGAASYRAYRGVGANVGSSAGNTITVSGLSPRHTYTINVAGVTASGATGPHSAGLKVTTKSAPKK